MKQSGKLDYIELSAAGGALDSVKSFYACVFGWSFTDYGVTYSAFNEGLEGGFQGDGTTSHAPLPVIFSDDLEAALVAVEQGGGTISRAIFSFPGGRRFHFTDPAGNELAVWGA
ncbi:MAG: VOC family protein [Mesorhizobium sp.]